MSIKSVVSSAKPFIAPDSYPILKINTGKTFIVLFTAANVGIVVHCFEKSLYSIGVYSALWDETTFVVFEDTVNLRNMVV